MAHDVFISYATPDKPTADAVCARLEQNGIRCWIAPRDILPGAPWKPSIVAAIKESRALVLIFSANANQSTEVPKEIDQAVKNGLSIVAFRIENVPPASGLDYELHGRHWLDALTAPLERHIDQLAHTLNALLQRPQSAAAPLPAVGTSKPGKLGLVVAAILLTLGVAVGIGWFVGSVSHSNPDSAQNRSAPPQSPPAAPARGPAPSASPAPMPSGALLPAGSGSLSPTQSTRAAITPPPRSEKQAAQTPASVGVHASLGADRSRQTVTRPSATLQPESRATAASVPEPQQRPAQELGLTGCWSYKSFLPLLITITADGKVSGLLEGGHWVNNGNGRYAITWPRSVDTITLSSDGRSLTGINNYGGDRVAVTGRRESGDARSPAGIWHWSNGASTTFRDDGSVTNGFMPGRWTRNPDATIRIVWDFAFVDQFTLSPDGQTLSGNNNIGQNVTATRVGCAA